MCSGLRILSLNQLLRSSPFSRHMSMSITDRSHSYSPFYFFYVLDPGLGGLSNRLSFPLRPMSMWYSSSVLNKLLSFMSKSSGLSIVPSPEAMSSRLSPAQIVLQNYSGTFILT